MSFEAKIRWPVLDMGKNSVIPSIIERIIAWRMVMVYII